MAPILSHDSSVSTGFRNHLTTPGRMRERVAEACTAHRRHQRSV